MSRVFLDSNLFIYHFEDTKGPRGIRATEIFERLSLRNDKVLTSSLTPGFVEVSAVCTHPDARGRGYGKAMTARVAEHIMQSGKTPYLHVFAANSPAIRAYESVGFTLRRTLELGVLRNDL